MVTHFCWLVLARVVLSVIVVRRHRPSRDLLKIATSPRALRLVAEKPAVLLKRRTKVRTFADFQK